MAIYLSLATRYVNIFTISFLIQIIIHFVYKNKHIHNILLVILQKYNENIFSHSPIITKKRRLCARINTLCTEHKNVDWAGCTLKKNKQNYQESRKKLQMPVLCSCAFHIYLLAHFSFMQKVAGKGNNNF